MNTMRKRLYLVGTLMIATILTLVVGYQLQKENLGSYVQKKFANLRSTEPTSEEEEEGADKALEWLKARYVDVSTGLPVTQEKLAQIQKKFP